MHAHNLKKNIIVTLKRTKYLVITNTFGIIIFVYFASRLWPTCMQEDIPLEFRTSDDFVSYIKTCLPILLFFSLLNLFWFIWTSWAIILGRGRNLKDWLLLMIWLMVGVMWFLTFQYDRDRSSLESASLQEFKKCYRKN